MCSFTFRVIVIYIVIKVISWVIYYYVYIYTTTSLLRTFVSKLTASSYPNKIIEIIYITLFSLISYQYFSIQKFVIM